MRWAMAGDNDERGERKQKEKDSSSHWNPISYFQQGGRKGGPHIAEYITEGVICKTTKKKSPDPSMWLLTRTRRTKSSL
jgi:hypothetical protein